MRVGPARTDDQVEVLERARFGQVLPNRCWNLVRQVVSHVDLQMQAPQARTAANGACSPGQKVLGGCYTSAGVWAQSEPAEPADLFEPADRPQRGQVLEPLSVRVDHQAADARHGGALPLEPLPGAGPGGRACGRRGVLVQFLHREGLPQCQSGGVWHSQGVHQCKDTGT